MNKDNKVQWDFSEATMLKMVFNRLRVGLVMRCETTVEFSVLLNGCPGECFRPTRGLQQEDPLSPYLFLIISEVLSWLFKHASEMGFLEGIRINTHDPRLSHLLFTDDTLIFLSVSRSNCENVDRLLKAYCHALGREVNTQKSMVYFSANTPPSVQYELCTILNMSRVEDPGTYLHILVGWGKTKMATLSYIKDWVLSKIQGWKNKFLSQAGHEMLIKAVVQAVPTYLMNVFWLPNRLCRDINGAIMRFWWANSNKARGIHWLIGKTWGCLSVMVAWGLGTLGISTLPFLLNRVGVLFRIPIHYGLGSLKLHISLTLRSWR